MKKLITLLMGMLCVMSTMMAQNNDRPIGINLSYITDWSPQFVFKDAMKQCRPWYVQRAWDWNSWDEDTVTIPERSDGYPELVADIHAAAEAAGRGGTHFDIGIMPPWMYIGDPPDDIGPHQLAGSADQIAEELLRERDLGANVYHVKFRGRDLSAYLDQLRAFASDVVPLVRNG